MQNRTWLIVTSILTIFFLGTLFWTFTINKDNKQLTQEIVYKDSLIAKQNIALDVVRKEYQASTKKFGEAAGLLKKEIAELRAKLNASKLNEAAITIKYQRIYEIINSKDSAAQPIITQELLSKSDELYQLIKAN